MLKNGIYNVIPSIIRIVLGAITVPILIRFLGIEEYGLWALTSAFINIIALADAGLSMSTTVFVARDLAQADAVERLPSTLTLVVGGMLVLASAALIGVVLFAPTIVRFTPTISVAQSATVIFTLQLAGVVVWLRLIQQSMVGIEQAYQRYDVMNAINTFQIIATNVGLIVTSYLGGQIVHLMYYTTAISALVLLFHFITCQRLLRKVPIRIQWEQAKAMTVTRYSITTWIGSLGGVLFGSVDRMIVGYFLGATALGIYSAITTVTVQINTISALPIKPLLPLLTQKLSHEYKSVSQEVTKIVRQSLQLNTAIALGFGGILITVAPVLLRVLIGDLHSPLGVTTLRLASAIYAIYSINAVGYHVLFSLNEVRMFMFVQLLSSLLALASIAAGAKVGGLLGATLGNAGYFGIWLLTTHAMKKLHISPATWLTWIKYPIIWFVGVCLINMVFVEIPYEFMIPLLFVQAISLFVWCMQIYDIHINHLLHRFTRQSYS